MDIWQSFYFHTVDVDLPHLNNTLDINVLEDIRAFFN